MRVITRLDPSVYFPFNGKTTGLEYDLATLFAQFLHVKIRFIVYRTYQEVVDNTLAGKSDITAAGLPISKTLQKQLRFAPSYQKVHEQLIYMGNRRKPESTDDLTRGILEIAQGSYHQNTLQKVKLKEPGLTWEINHQLGSIGLLYLLDQGLIDYTIANSNQISLMSRYFPKLHVAFNFEQPQQLAWALPLQSDELLYREVVNFFQTIKQNGTLNQLLERYYGDNELLNYFDHYSFRQDAALRLPKYRRLYQQAANLYGFDWRLLAALGYQESHWKAKATSQTGVRGLMMLTDATANQLGIKDRLDPKASILGGAMYLDRIKQKIPERIQEPDRTWLALASYNIGFSHLEDARILTQQQKRNPDRWVDVKPRLLLLEIKKWHKQTRHGFARGQEAVQYVKKVRAFYDLLVWFTEKEQIEQLVMQPTETVTGGLPIRSLSTN